MHMCIIAEYYAESAYFIFQCVLLTVYKSEIINFDIFVRSLKFSTVINFQKKIIIKMIFNILHSTITYSFAMCFANINLKML